MRITTQLATVATVALVTSVATLTAAAPANAAGRLGFAGTGTSEVGATSVDVAGSVGGTPVSGPYTGRVTVTGGVPPVGECRPAHAVLTVADAAGQTITLASDGQVCSTIVPSVLQDFRGRFETTGYSKRGWKNLSGFLQIRAVDGISDVYATS